MKNATAEEIATSMETHAKAILEVVKVLRGKAK